MNKQEIIDGLNALVEFVRESDTEDEDYYLHAIENAVILITCMETK
jgi:hypothetical protein